jgi:hypothetical protein
VVIKASSTRQIDALVADLGSDRVVTREAALARLTVIGARAVERLVTLVSSDAPASSRTAALRALEAIGDARGRDAILRAIDDLDATVAVTAIAAARADLRGLHGADALDHLTRTALDRTRHESVRAAAVDAVRELDPSTIAPLLDALRDDLPLSAAAGRALPDDPAVLRQAIAHEGGQAPLQALLRVIESVRDREAQETPARRSEWRAVRAAAHLALANRGSRIALFDVRESLESADAPLPVELLAALSVVGDESCLEPIAAAHTRARDGWSRTRLADAFQTIVKREGLTRRHAAIKRIEKRSPETFRALWNTAKAGGAGRAGTAGG